MYYMARPLLLLSISFCIKCSTDNNASENFYGSVIKYMNEEENYGEEYVIKRKRTKLLNKCITILEVNVYIYSRKPLSSTSILILKIDHKKKLSLNLQFGSSIL